MTILAFDGTTLAADKRAVNNGLRRTVTKIFRVDDKLVGFAGDLANGLELVEWVRAGCIISNYPKSQEDKDSWDTLVVIDADGLRVYETRPYAIKFEDPFWACGSGRDYALAAMYLGKNAAEAVEIAGHFEISCGNGVDTLTLGEKE